MYLALAAFVSCDSGRKAGDASVDAGMANTGGSDLGDDGRGGQDSDSDGGLTPTPAHLTVTPTQAFLQTTANASVELTVTVKTTGGLPSGTLLLSMTGPDASQFQIFQGNCPNGVAPGRSCAVFLTFLPPDTPPDPNLGAQASATLVVADSQAPDVVFPVEIDVVILVPSENLAILGPADMGTVVLGGSGANLPFIVVNTGTDESGPLQVSMASSQFTKTVDACTGISLPSAGTCSFSIQFSPSELGAERAILTIQGPSALGVASEIIAGTCVAP